MVGDESPETGSINVNEFKFKFVLNVQKNQETFSCHRDGITQC